MKIWKLIGKIEKEYDFNTKSYLHFLSYGGVSKMQLPQNDKLSLNLTNNYLVFQMVLISPKSFSIEIAITDTNNIKRRLIFTSSLKEITFTNFHCRIPLLNFPINKWTNFEINVASLTNDCFKNNSLKCIDYIRLSANCKIRKIVSLKNSIFNSPLPRGLNLPLSLQVENYHYYYLSNGLTKIKEKNNIIEIENGLGKVIAQNKTNEDNENILSNTNTNKPIYDLKQLRSKSTNKPFKEKKKIIKDNGNSNNENSNNQSTNEMNSYLRSNIHDKNNQGLTHFQELHQKYQSLNKKTKNNIKFAKKIPSIEQVQSQIKYDISGRKLPSYFIESSPKIKAKKINEYTKEPNIPNESNCLINLGKKSNSPLNKNNQIKEELHKTSVKIPLKTNNYTNNGNITEEKKEGKLLNTFNINNLYKQQPTNLCDSIEENFDFNENGTLVDDSIANGKNYKENIQNDIIHIDKGKFPTNISNQNIELHKEGEENKEKKEFLEELYNDENVNFTLESNRPFTPPISKLVPVKVGETIKNNNLISPQDKQNISKQTNTKESHVNYDNLIYDDDIGYYYNPLTKMYYDLKN